MGSRNLPKSVTKLCLRARCPSKKSVIEARIKITNASKREKNLFAKINPMQIKDKKIRKKVSLLEIFMLVVLDPRKEAKTVFASYHLSIHLLYYTILDSHQIVSKAIDYLCPAEITYL